MKRSTLCVFTELCAPTMNIDKVSIQIAKKGQEKNLHIIILLYFFKLTFYFYEFMIA